MNQQRNWTGWILIAAIVVFSGVALAASTLAGNVAEPTADSDLQKHEAVLRTFFPEAGEDADGFERLDADGEGFVYRIRQGEAIVGYAVQQAVQGYGGPIELIVAVRSNHTLGGVRVGGEGFSETEGLGAKAKDEAFTGQFRGAQLPVKLGGEIDAITGATVTSRAVVDGVNTAVQRLYAIEGLISPTPDASAAQTERTANASVIGYAGPVLVRLTLDEQDRIEALEIGWARFLETEGVGSRVREAEFTQRLIGQTPPLTLGEEIDALSGATRSSQAAVDAVNAAYAFLKESPTDTK